MKNLFALPSMPFAQAKVFKNDNGDLALVSYKTTVIEIADGWLYCNGLYSATTRKHISAFMHDFTRFDYYLAKKCYCDNVRFNIYTGEIQPL